MGISLGAYWNNLLLFLLVLTAVNEDSPTVPGLLTDYILKGIFKNILSLNIFVNNLFGKVYSDHYFMLFQ